MVPAQHEIYRSGSRTFVPSRPFFQRAISETPKLRSVRSDLDSTTTNEEEIVSALRESIKGGRFVSGVKFQWKMDPRISGGTIVDMFSNEFRALLSSTMSPAPSSICSSKSRMRSMLISRPTLSSPTRVSRRQIPQNKFTYHRGRCISMT